ncbi:TetR/AcrR family transcriptional regulator [Microbacterium sp. SORGH_AS_0888]|uniref:TetR/AcrR family transcriptional regulator n=1 Tax=Microbacterium sp. SORGH_AS_0888 TaxID=3041791 RepID=UPI00277EB7A3|nr:TetR/AcrR family transcriptional regulator [Microbacterium sp. SORGH_AS_0888]MDQ1130105.1 AcrR family transcriptional regulator [Microbacterium sp. SORGH_AS_0888]
MSATSEPVSRRDRPAKAPLSRQSILAAAKELIRARGVDGVSLRQVADAVQTGPASLYAYFANRDVLLEHVLDDAYAEVVLVDPSEGGWQRALTDTVVNTIETLQSYPGLGAVALVTIPTRPGALRLAEHELTLLHLGGIEERTAALGIDLLAQFAAATAIERTAADHGTAERERARTIYGSADAATYPRVAGLAAALTGPDEHARRDFGIRVILDGLARATTASASGGL